MANLAADAGLAARRLADHINISREHTPGIRPMPGLRLPQVLAT